MTGSAARILELALADGILTLPEPGAEGVLVETLLSEESPQEPGAISGAGRTGQRYGVITSQSLSQRPSAVLARVEDGERLVVTRHGRFMVFLLPLPKEMTAQLLASAVAFLASLDSGSRDGEGYGYPVDLAEILAGR
jgi:prevent-host-death family protein